MLHGLAVLSLLGLALLGQVPGEVAGWLVLPAVRGAAGRPRAAAGCGRGGRWWACALAALGGYLAQSWPPVLLRSLLLWGLWAWSGRLGAGLAAAGAVGLVVVAGCGGGLAAVAPAGGCGAGWQRGLWQAQRLVLVGYLGLALSQPAQLGARRRGAWGWAAWSCAAG